MDIERAMMLAWRREAEYCEANGLVEAAKKIRRRLAKDYAHLKAPTLELVLGGRIESSEPSTAKLTLVSCG